MMALIRTHDPVGSPSQAHEAGDLAEAEDPDPRPETLRQTGYTSHTVNLEKVLEITTVTS